MLKLFWNILKDERGKEGNWWERASGQKGLAAAFDPWGFFGEGEEEVYDPYAGLRGDWQSWLKSKLGTSTPYTQNPAFTLEQPPVEKAAESTILGRLGNLPTAEEYKGRVEASKTQQISREKERAFEQKEEESNMYNRLGLVSSTPWMTRAGELGEESLGRQKDIETGMDIFGLGYGLESEKAMSDIGSRWAGLGSVLGGQQRGYQQYAQGMSMQDLQRMLSEEMGYGSQAASILGGTQPQREYTPNMIEELMGYGADMLPYILMMMA